MGADARSRRLVLVLVLDFDGSTYLDRLVLALDLDRLVLDRLVLVLPVLVPAV